MPLPQLKLCATARKHGAKTASATAMHGAARFEHETDALAFVNALHSDGVASVQVYKQHATQYAVDWTMLRTANAQITGIRSRS